MKGKKIKDIYVKNFILIIVIPILIIGISATIILLKQSQNAMDENIRLIEKSITDMLEKEIENYSLQLSHFLLTNDNQVLDTLSLYNMSKGKERYSYQEILKNQYNLLVIPKTQLLGMQIYMKGNEEYSFKNNIILTNKEIREKKWYKDTLKNQDVINVAVENKNILIRNIENKNQDKVLLFSIYPEKYDYYDQIEIVVMCVKSDVINLIESTKGWEDNVSVYLIDENKNIILNSDNEYENIIKNIDSNRGVIDGINYNVTNIRNTKWKLITMSKVNFMTKGYKLFLLLIILGVLFIFGIFYFYSKRFLKKIIIPIDNIAKEMEKHNINNAYVLIEEDAPYEIQVIQNRFNQMILRIQRLIIENEKKEAEKHKEEIKALQFQINPHFLSNTLNTIRFMAHVAKYDGIRKMTESLIQILDCSFRNNNSFHTLEDEIQMINSYLYIMGIRYANNFNTEFQIDKGCHKCLIPKLILQPLFENSIVHGLEDKDDIGNIIFRIRKEYDNLNIEIIDDGKGMPKDKISEVIKKDPDKTNKIGIANIYKRLKLYYGKDFKFNIFSEENKYTKVQIIIPYIVREEEERYV